MKNVKYKFQFSGTDKCGDVVSSSIIVEGSGYAKCFTSATRKFFSVFPGGKIESSSVGEKVL